MEPFGNKFNKPEDNMGNRKERMLKLINFLRRIDSKNSAEDLKEKKELIQKLSFEEFQDLLLRINGILRNIPIKKRTFHTNPESPPVKLIKEGRATYVPPPNSEKTHLLKEAFEALKRMNLSDRDIEAAMMMGATIDAVHPFEDGNGRTSRVVSVLLASSRERFLMTSTNPESIQMLIEDYITECVHHLKGMEIFDIETAAADIYTYKISEREMYELAIIEQDDLRDLVNACRIFAQKEGDDFESLFISPDTKKLSLKSFFSKYRDKIPAIIETYRQLKNEYIRVLIDVFENPKKYGVAKLSVFNTLPEINRKAYSSKTIVDIFYFSLREFSSIDDEFSWDYFIKLIEEQPS